ncbi:hypothetical protein JHK84_043110 [Glycine max]|nr:hypothetical protein JHK84_043110 [Glycine max]
MLALFDSSLASSKSSYIHILPPFDDDNQEVFVALDAWENPIGYKKLHDILFDFESYLKRYDNNNNDLLPVASAHAGHRGKPSYHKKQYMSTYRQSSSTPPKVFCQYYGKPRHIAKVCLKITGYPKRPPHLVAYHASYGSWTLMPLLTSHLTLTTCTSPLHSMDMKKSYWMMILQSL